MNNTTRGTLAMVLTAFLWSTAGLFIKLIDWNPFAIAGLRSLIAALVIYAYLLATGTKPRFFRDRNQVLAAVAITFTMLLFVISNKTTTATNAIVLQYIAPVLTAILGALILKERIKPEELVAIPVVLAGIVIMFLDKLGGGKLLGDCLSLTAGLTFSFFFIFMRRQKDGSPIESQLLAHFFTAATGLIACFFLPAPNFSTQSVLAIFALGVIQIGIPAMLFVAAIKRIPAVSASVIAVIEPVFNPIWVFLILAEKPTPNAIIGGVLIILAVTLSSVLGARRAARA